MLHLKVTTKFSLYTTTGQGVPTIITTNLQKIVAVELEHNHNQHSNAKTHTFVLVRIICTQSHTKMQYTTAVCSSSLLFSKQSSFRRYCVLDQRVFSCTPIMLSLQTTGSLRVLQCLNDDFVEQRRSAFHHLCVVSLL